MSLLVAMPCYGGNLTVGGFRSLLGIAQICGQHDVDVDFLVNHGESAITRGRSNMAAEFLRGDKDTLMFLDADILIQPEDFFALYELDRPVRGAAVNLKTLDQSECLSCFVNGEQSVRAKMPDEPFECHFFGSSVMFIEREVLELMSHSYDTLAYVDRIAGPGVHLFQEIVLDKTSLLSEDYAFCYRARECGFSLWVDPKVKVSHFDGRIAWSF